MGKDLRSAMRIGAAALKPEYRNERTTGGVTFSYSPTDRRYDGVSLSLWGDEVGGRVDDDSLAG